MPDTRMLVTLPEGPRKPLRIGLPPAVQGGTMKLADLDRAAMLRDRRLRTIALRDGAGHGSLAFKVWHCGNATDPFEAIPSAPIRAAMVAACDAAIADLDAELVRLGVDEASLDRSYRE